MLKKLIELRNFDIIFSPNLNREKNELKFLDLLLRKF